jgi:hypothetical protein
MSDTKCFRTYSLLNFFSNIYDSSRASLLKCHIGLYYIFHSQYTVSKLMFVHGVDSSDIIPYWIS